jgi:nitrogen fixation/metabolism regulation signal transduction histidine kinase
LNPIAHRKFKRESASTFVLRENISELEYISAYSAIHDNNLTIRGFVNLPYYTNREDLYRQISSYLVTVVNVFVLLFALVYVITQMVSRKITQPLLRIRDEISRMKLGVKNEPIVWNRQDEIGLLVSEYNKMLDALDDSLDKLSEVERQGAWREMAKQVAHEIKNPLTPMRLSMQHLEYSMNRNDANIQEKTTKTIKLLIRQIDSLSSMAEEFSSFAKMPEPKLEEVDLIEILQDAASLMEREMGCSIERDFNFRSVWILADPHQLGRVFNNLFKNALQAIPDSIKAHVSVTVNVDDDRVVLHVKDNGKGIEDSLKDKIFSPNFSTKNSGMGLGLAITKKIIEQFQGTISFDSTVNVGTTFTLQFPLLRK